MAKFFRKIVEVLGAHTDATISKPVKDSRKIWKHQILYEYVKESLRQRSDGIFQYMLSYLGGCHTRNIIWGPEDEFRWSFQRDM